MEFIEIIQLLLQKVRKAIFFLPSDVSNSHLHISNILYFIKSGIQCTTLTYLQMYPQAVIKPNLKTQFSVEVPTQLPDKFYFTR